MRTVFVFPAQTLAVTTELLSQMMPGEDRYWTDGNLFVDLDDEQNGNLFTDWEPDDVRLVDTALGYHPTWALQVNISGRIDGTSEIRAFAAQVLNHGGIAVDDYTTHCWTLQEIESNLTVDGLAFFDFRTHYELNRQI